MSWKQVKRTIDGAGDIARMTFLLYETGDEGFPLVTVGIVRRMEPPRGPRIKVTAVMGELSDIFIPDDIWPTIIKEVEAIQRDVHE